MTAKHAGCVARAWGDIGCPHSIHVPNNSGEWCAGAGEHVACVASVCNIHTVCSAYECNIYSVYSMHDSTIITLCAWDVDRILITSGQLQEPQERPRKLREHRQVRPQGMLA